MFADPVLLAVSNPLPFTVTTPELSDCQFAHEAVTFEELPLDIVAVAVTWDVAPTDLKAERSADKATELTVGLAGVVGVDDPLLPPQPATAKNKTTNDNRCCIY